MRAIKQVITVKNLPCMDSLIRLNLPTLKYRRIRGDMIEVYKILKNRHDADVNIRLQQLQSNATRGNNLKLANTRCYYDLRKYSFRATIRVVNIWNSRPESVISADSVDTAVCQKSCNKMAAITMQSHYAHAIRQLN